MLWRNITDLLEVYLNTFRFKSMKDANINDKYVGISCVLRAKVARSWLSSRKKESCKNKKDEHTKSAYYISLEYNLGSPMKMQTTAADLKKDFGKLMKIADVSEEILLEAESPVELGSTVYGDFTGNILELFASKNIPSVAYGLWYDFGQFKQTVNYKWQQEEMPYYWTFFAHPWLIENSNKKYPVPFDGKIRIIDDNTFVWDYDDVIISAGSLDYLIPGYRNKFVNTMRFWKALPNAKFNKDYSHHNDYVRACDDNAASVKFMRHLFYDETFRQTSELHIQQQYFIASASIGDIVTRHYTDENGIDNLAKDAVIVLADCRSGLAIIELVRILCGFYKKKIAEAVAMVRKIFVATMPLSDSREFQNIPLYVFETMLPAHHETILKINDFIINEALDRGANGDDLIEISLIEEGAMKKLRMANLLLLLSRKILTYSENDAENVMKIILPNTSHFYKNINVEPSFSAISIRRWLVYTNENLTKLISSKIGTDWIKDNSKLEDFERFIYDTSVQSEFEKIKLAEKDKFLKKMGGYFPREALFINHSKKITMANSQILLLFYIAYRYLRLEENKENLIPRIYLFSGRATPTDYYGKQLFTLIGIFAEKLKDNPKLRIHFTCNRNALTDGNFLAAGDVVEYVSSPDTVEVSAFNIYRCAANGIITLNGANKVESQAAKKLGKDTTFSFGNPDADTSNYDVNSLIESSKALRDVFKWLYEIVKEFLGDAEDAEKIYPLLNTMRTRDEMKNLLNFREYCEIQDEIDTAFKDKEKWNAMALRNIARSRVGSIDNAVWSIFNEKEGWKK